MIVTIRMGRRALSCGGGGIVCFHTHEASGHFETIVTLTLRSSSRTSQLVAVCRSPKTRRQSPLPQLGQTEQQRRHLQLRLQRAARLTLEARRQRLTRATEAAQQLGPASTLARGYAIARWTEMPAGGHFATLEQPAAMLRDIQAFFEDISSG